MSAPVKGASWVNNLSLAQVVDPENIPDNVVTMHSIVKVKINDASKEQQLQLVYPRQANVKENKISILSPIGTLLIGAKSGKEVKWIRPSVATKIKIIDIIYQPEAAGDMYL
ncbi:MAG: GreA/GreB family elongation factor [Lentimicrobium sp.]